ncbi:hypothetical protein Tco_1427825 [Tanacetum coccineum]
MCRSYIPYRDRRLSISEEALGAFGKSQTYRDKEVNVTARDSDNALVCCIKNTVEGRIMDSSASFHATYCKDELERFKLHSGKVRLANDKTLDIAGVGDVVLKTSFGASWTLKVVKYIPSLKRRLISVGQLDEEGYHVSFGDQQWFGMSMLASKGNVPDVQKVDIYFFKPGGLGKQKNLSFIMLEKTRKLQRVAYSRGGMAREGYKSPTLKENDSIVTEHRLSSKITQSPGGSSDTSERSKNCGSFEDSGRSDEEYSEDGASSKGRL